MTMYRAQVIDSQLLSLSTRGSASGSIATFDTDRAERLVKCVCEVASGASSISVFVNSVNMWSETWEIGNYLSDGTKGTVTDCIRSKTKFKITPNTTYYMVINYNAWVCYYDNNGVFLSGATKYNSGTFTTPNNAYYMAFSMWSAYGTTYNHNISINNDESTTYHAFSGVVVDFGETLSDDGTFDVLSGILTRSDDTTKQLNANYIQTNNGINNVYCDTGNTGINYIMTVGKAIS